MKNKTLFWVLGIIVVLFAIFIGGSMMIMSSFSKFPGKSPVTVKQGSYLVIDLLGGLSEYNARGNVSFFDQKKHNTVSDILLALEKAKTDSRIKGIVFRPLSISGFAEIRELREAVRRFKSCGKPVYSYMDIGTDRDYYLSSIADTIVLVPAKSGGLAMLGLGISQTYMAKTFEKVGLKFNVLHCGDYKGAYENFGRESMSEPLRESLQYLIDGEFKTYVSEIVADRKKLSAETLNKELLDGDKYFITGPDALKKGFVDLLMDWQTFKSTLTNGKDFESTTVSRYLKTSPEVKTTKKEIAVLFAEGEIHYSIGEKSSFTSGDGIQSSDLIHQLRDLRDDDNVAAVVLRVNSPGGSALASELILQEVKRLKEKKPVVVSMGNVAASGGYYISCAANTIIAQPSTITGSIGVVGMIPTAEGLYKKIEAKVETVEKGKWSQYIRFDKDFTAEQKTVLLQMMKDIYDEFLDRVADGRKMSVDDVTKVASGRIWTGTQALDRKLIDEVGGLDLAVKRARELVNLNETNSEVRNYPEKELWFIALLNELGDVRVSLNNLFLSQEEREILQAVDYFKEFQREHTFVRAYTPITTEF